jgi:hypothetical protein
VAALPGAQRASSDQTANGALASQLPGFPQASASDDRAALSRHLAPRAAISGLDGTVSFGSTTPLQVPPARATRDGTATVDRTLLAQAGTMVPGLATSYDMSVVDQQSGRWYVEDIRASTQPMGTQ